MGLAGFDCFLARICIVLDREYVEDEASIDLGVPVAAKSVLDDIATKRRVKEGHCTYGSATRSIPSFFRAFGAWEFRLWAADLRNHTIVDLHTRRPKCPNTQSNH